MPQSWYIVMIILGIVLFFVCIITCRMFYRDQLIIRELIEPVRDNRVHPLPVAIGVEVYGPQRGVQVITVENI